MGIAINLQTDYYMIMSRNDWFYHVVTQMIFLRVHVEAGIFW